DRRHPADFPRRVVNIGRAGHVLVRRLRAVLLGAARGRCHADAQIHRHGPGSRTRTCTCADQARHDWGRVKDTIMTILVDYETLRLIWWLFLGVLLIGFAIMDGFDLGVAALLPYVARTDTERRVAINTIGPVWDGNQVWLILGGGAVFAAWPMIYAASFSGFYIAMFLVLAALILRPVGFEFRNKIADPRWRAFWDYALF